MEKFQLIQFDFIHLEKIKKSKKKNWFILYLKDKIKKPILMQNSHLGKTSYQITESNFDYFSLVGPK